MSRLTDMLRARKRIPASAGNRGAALITVLVAMMIMSIILLELQYNAMVERKLAYNELDQLKAYYLAKSGARIGLLRVVLYGRARANPDLKKAFGGQDVTSFLDAIWNLPLPAFPPDVGKIKGLLKDDKDVAEKQLKQTKVSDGNVTHVITSEGSKINLNALIVPASVLAQNNRIQFTCTAPTELYMHYGCLLINLLENFLQSSDDPFREFGNLRPEELVMDIMDWVNPGANRFNGGGKDSFYEQQVPPYKAKRNRFYTVDELKLVKGIDDHLFNKLKPFVTVYSEDGKININTAGSNIFKALYRDFTDEDIKKLLEKRAELNGFLNEKQFVDYVTSTLGRSGFSSIYGDAAKYPFTVSSRSFVIESLGVVRKSKSQVQKVIRVAVALVRAQLPGGVVQGVATPGDCVTDQSRFWDPRQNVCKVKPTNLAECQTEAGTWDASKSPACCNINNISPVCLTPATQGTAGTAPAPVEPNAVKILSWSET